MNHKRHSQEEKELFFAQWDDLRSKVQGKGKPALPLADVSGSMTGVPMENSIALSILLSELGTGVFQNQVITFSANPTWVDLSDCANLEQKVHKLAGADWGMNTNIAKVFDMILHKVLESGMISEEIPYLIIFSDMQFDVADKNHSTHLERAQKKFADKGLECPRIIFWNLRDATGLPAKSDDSNVILLSGFSQSLLKYVLEDEEVVEEVKPTPLETFLKIINDKRYDSVRELLSEKLI